MTDLDTGKKNAGGMVVGQSRVDGEENGIEQEGPRAADDDAGRFGQTRAAHWQHPLHQYRQGEERHPAIPGVQCFAQPAHDLVATIADDDVVQSMPTRSEDVC
jgi:hypothetical protein